MAIFVNNIQVLHTRYREKFLACAAPGVDDNNFMLNGVVHFLVNDGSKAFILS